MTVFTDSVYNQYIMDRDFPMGIIFSDCNSASRTVQLPTIRMMNNYETQVTIIIIHALKIQNANSHNICC
jgi:hypothetical protein